MHVLFLAPETHVYNHLFVAGLKATGARVTGLGHAPPGRLHPRLRRLLDGYVPLKSLFHTDSVVAAARSVSRARPVDRVETIDEPLVVPAAEVREALGVAGLSRRVAVLCRDKAEMKAHLRAAGIPCAQSAAASSDAEVRAFAERAGFPIVLKPRQGFGSLDTHRVGSAVELDRALARMKLGPGRSIAVEEYVEGHEGFYDTITLDGGRIGHHFVAHYYPGCLEATVRREVNPQIAVTNRMQAEGYRELFDVGRRVIEALGIERSATHMEWFFGPKGLKVSEIGARPAGEKIWDLYRAANEFDVYREWALAVTRGQTHETPSRRYAAGSIQIRPERDGRIARHEGLEQVLRVAGEHIYESSVPPPGTPTQPIEKGWLVNTWFRLRHPDYDRLRELMDFIGRTVKVRVR